MYQFQLTAGNRTMVVTPTNISVFPSHSGIKSNAAWIACDQINLGYTKSWITQCERFPRELALLIDGVLNASAPVQPLMDWVIEYGLANLAREIERFQENLLNAAAK